MKIDAITRDGAAIEYLAKIGARSHIQALAHVLYLCADGTQSTPTWPELPHMHERHACRILRDLAEGYVLRDAVVCAQYGGVRGDAVKNTLLA